jgi:hypothetical protein
MVLSAGSATFSQQIWLVLLQASSTAILVAILGGITASSWTRRRERRQEAFGVRTKLLNDSARIGQGMYVFLQHTRRKLIQARDEGEANEALAALDERFLTFSIEAAELQTILGARFGVARSLESADTDPDQPFLRWHQIHDLLALYYYNVKDFFPGIVLAEAARGHQGNLHSGLDLELYQDRAALTSENLRLMRRQIRTAYDDAMIRLTDGITTSHVRLD